MIATTLKWLGAAWLAVALLAGHQDAMAQQPHPPADPAVWGIYARLVGTTWNGEGGKAEWQWGPDNTIVERRLDRVGKVIRPGNRPGELLASYGGKAPDILFEGHMAADGSVLWISTISRSAPIWREAIVDGLYRDERVKLDDANRVVSVKRTWVNHQTGGTPVTAVAVAASPVAQPSPTADVVVEPQAPMPPMREPELPVVPGVTNLYAGKALDRGASKSRANIEVFQFMAGAGSKVRLAATGEGPMAVRLYAPDGSEISGADGSGTAVIQATLRIDGIYFISIARREKQAAYKVALELKES